MSFVGPLRSLPFLRQLLSILVHPHLQRDAKTLRELSSPH